MEKRWAVRRGGARRTLDSASCCLLQNWCVHEPLALNASSVQSTSSGVRGEYSLPPIVAFVGSGGA
eukprot:5442688-Prymnesium_polylepis.1